MELMDFFKQTGRKGGKLRMKALTDAEKRELGRKAGLASGKVRSAKAKAKAKADAKAKAEEAPPVAQASPKTRRKG